MGTEARIVIHAPDSAAAAGAAAAAFARIAEIDAHLSDYRRDGDVARIASAGPDEAVSVSRDLTIVLSRALALAARTDGAFDPAVGALVRLWREARRTGRLPDPAPLHDALTRSGWRNVVVDTAARTVSSRVAGLGLDFGGIGKGWAADEALDVLRSRGMPHALIEFGGEVVAGAPPPGEPGWRVQTMTGDTVRLVAGAISTSGDAAQFVVVGGVRWSHVVDPRTGLGLRHGRSATVRAPRGWLADALATAATVLDDAGLARLRRAFPGAEIVVS